MSEEKSYWKPHFILKQDVNGDWDARLAEVFYKDDEPHLWTTNAAYISGWGETTKESLEDAVGLLYLYSEAKNNVVFFEMKNGSDEYLKPLHPEDHIDFDTKDESFFFDYTTPDGEGSEDLQLNFDDDTLNKIEELHGVGIKTPEGAEILYNMIDDAIKNIVEQGETQ